MSWEVPKECTYEDLWVRFRSKIIGALLLRARMAKDDKEVSRLTEAIAKLEVGAISRIDGFYIGTMNKQGWDINDLVFEDAWLSPANSVNAEFKLPNGRSVELDLELKPDAEMSKREWNKYRVELTKVLVDVLGAR